MAIYGQAAGVASRDQEETQTVPPTIEAAQENLMLDVTARERLPAVAARHAHGASGMLSAPQVTHCTAPSEKPRRRPHWVTEISKNLEVPDARPQHQNSQSMQPTQQRAEHAAPLQLQTIAQRVENVKQSTFPRQLPEQHPMEQDSKIPRPPQSLQCSVINAPAEALPARCASPQSSGGWQLTTLHAPRAAIGTSKLSSSNSACKEARTSEHASEGTAAAASGGPQAAPQRFRTKMISGLCPSTTRWQDHTQESWTHTQRQPASVKAGRVMRCLHHTLLTQTWQGLK